MPGYEDVHERSVRHSVLARTWLAPVVTTLNAWPAAFVVVMTLLTLFGDELGSLPLALRALVLTGVLVASWPTSSCRS
jgi:antibiotic biosynthesis monooxygenase (ABM) superfamily enzyme